MPVQASWLGLTEFEEASRGLFGLVLFVILLAGILKCCQIARRPTTHGVCVLSLAMALAAYAVGMIVSIPSIKTALPPALVVILGMLVILAFAASPVLGIVGLVSLARNRERYVQGSAQAIWGLVLGGATLLATFIYVAVKVSPEARSDSEVHRIEQVNLSFRAPGRAWTPGPPERGPWAVTFYYQRLSPRIEASIQGELLGIERAMDLSAVIRTGLPSGAMAGSDAVELSRESVHVNGIAGMLVEIDCTIDGVRSVISVWYGLRNGFLYRVLVVGERTHRKDVRECAAGLRREVRPLDPARIAHQPGTIPLEEIRCPGLGFTASFPDAGWRFAQELAETAPWAAVRAMYGPDVGFLIVPIEIDRDLPPPDDGILVPACLRLVPLPRENIEAPPIRCGPATGCEMRWEVTENDRPVHYHARLLRCGRFAYFLCGWYRGDAEPLPGLLGRALDGVRFEAAPDGAPATVVGWLPALTRTTIFGHLGDEASVRADAVAATAYYRAAFRANPLDGSLLLKAVTTLERLGRAAEALALAEEHAGAFRDDPVLRAVRARVLGRTGRIEEGIREFEALLDAGRLEGEGRLDHVELLHTAGRHAEALELLDAAVAAGQKDARTWFLRGACEMGLDRLEEAKTSLERALALSPEDAGILRLLRALAGRLGQGDNSTVRDAIAPVPLPEEMLREIDGLLASSLRPGTGPGPRYMRVIEAHEFRPREVLRTTSYQSIEIVEAADVERFSTLSWPFDPLAERIFANRIEVLERDGTVAATADPNDAYVVADPRAGEASHDKILRTPLRGLRPGCRIECVVTRDHLAPPDRFPLLQHVFASDEPAGLSGCLIRGEIGRLRHAATGLPRFGSSDGALWWLCAAPPVRIPEPLQPPDSMFLPTLRVGDASATWEAVVREYLAILSDRLEVTEPVRRLAGELTAGLEDEAGRIRALARHVQSGFTYKSIRFGQRTLVPVPVEQTLERRWGDCKEHALLLVLLLRAAGLTAHPALVHTTQPVHPGFPSLEAFDHMIVYLPDREWFLDPTGKDTDVTAPVPFGLEGRDALVLDRERPRFARIPPLPPDTAGLRSRRRVRLAPESGTRTTGQILIRDEVTAHGPLAGRLRDHLRTMPDVRPLLAEALRFLGASPCGESIVRHLEEPDQPLVIETTSSLEGMFHRVDGRLAGSLPLLWERWVIDVDRVPERVTPFETRPGVLVESTVELEIPEGFEIRELPPSGSADRAPFAAWEWRWERADGAIRLTYRLRCHAGRFEAGRYEDFCRAMEDARAPFRTTLLLDRR